MSAPGIEQETDASWAYTCDPSPVTLDHDGKWKLVVSLDATGTGHDLTMLRGTEGVNGTYQFHIESSGD